MRNSRLWARMLGVESGTVIEGIEWERNPGEQVTLVTRVRPHKRRAGRCGICGRRCPGYDHGEGRRRWRALDLGTLRAELEAEAPRVNCRGHGVVVAAVPRARHGAAHTRAFEDTIAWLACVTSKTTITQLMRVGWRAVGHIRQTEQPTRACRDLPRRSPRALDKLGQLGQPFMRRRPLRTTPQHGYWVQET